MRNKVIKQQEILDLAQRNYIVHHCLQYWKDEKMSWEEAMTYCVFFLAQANQEYEQNAVKMMDLRPPAPIVLMLDPSMDLGAAKEIFGKK